MDAEQPTDWPATKEAAKAAGVRFFFPGTPCAKGHVGLRTVCGNGRCVECARATNAAQYQKRREEYLANRKERYLRNREAVLKQCAEYYEMNKERRRERDRLNAAAYRAKHPEQCKATVRRHFLENREQYRLGCVAYRARNLEKCRELNRAWGKANPDKVRAQAHLRRARKMVAPGRYTAEDIAAIRKAQKDRCAYCRAPLKRRGHVDHIKALSKGGSNYPANLQLTCRTCNSSKHNRDPIEFAQRRGLLL